MKLPFLLIQILILFRVVNAQNHSLVHSVKLMFTVPLVVDISRFFSPSFVLFRLQEPDVVLAMMAKSSSLPMMDPLTLPLFAFIVILRPAYNSSSLVVPEVADEEMESFAETLTALREPEVALVVILSATTSVRVLVPEVVVTLMSPSAVTVPRLTDPLLQLSVMFPRTFVSSMEIPPEVLDAVIPVLSVFSTWIEPEVVVRFIFPSDAVSCTEMPPDVLLKSRELTLMLSVRILPLVDSRSSLPAKDSGTIIVTGSSGT